MDVTEKLHILSEDACYEKAEPLERTVTSQQVPARVRECIQTHLSKAIYVAKAPMRTGTRHVPLLKTLLTNACRNDCRYCGTSCLVDHRIVSLKPNELAVAFMEMYKRGIVKGLFLSSSVVRDPDSTMERLIDTARLLRQRMGYRGYIHLKIMPGASEDVVREAARWADRISCNLEAPNARRLQLIAPSKDFQSEIWRTLEHIGRCVKEGKVRNGYTTQLVVGAAGENDREILSTVERLYHEHNLHRAYYSAFFPIHGTPMEDHPPTPRAREVRLYQADWLLRFYGFKLDELIFDEDGNLPMDCDPKLAWARAHPEWFPIEINAAPRELLLRIPGIGLQTASRILEAREHRRITTLEELHKLGAVAQRVAPFVLLNGRLPKCSKSNLQLRLEM